MIQLIYPLKINWNDFNFFKPLFSPKLWSIPFPLQISGFIISQRASSLPHPLSFWYAELITPHTHFIRKSAPLRVSMSALIALFGLSSHIPMFSSQFFMVSMMDVQMERNMHSLQRLFSLGGNSSLLTLLAKFSKRSSTSSEGSIWCHSESSKV